MSKGPSLFSPPMYSSDVTLGHGRTSVVDICERTSLAPGSCTCLGHPAVIGVSPALPATDNTSVTRIHPLSDLLYCDAWGSRAVKAAGRVHGRHIEALRALDDQESDEERLPYG